MGSLKHSAPATSINPKHITSEIREGDWVGYQQHCNYFSSKDFASRNENLNAYRQQCALAYLGKRAQLRGGVCSKMQARIFTTQFLIELEVTNKKERYSRYPWLEKLVELVAEIEREQDKYSIIDNVVSLVTATNKEASLG